MINDKMVNDKMVNSQKIRAVFFDQDGVLFDSMPCHAKAWEMAMNENGVPYTAMDCYRNEGRTGSGQRNLINSLNDTFDGVFTGIISAFDVKYGKPNPEPYLKAWERSGFKKEECMVVENAPLGTRAAKAAGLFTCAVNTGILPDADLEAEHADKVFPNMAALLKWLQDSAILSV